MQILLITGPSGVGKSTLLRRGLEIEGASVHLVDPLSNFNGHKRFEEPVPEGVTAVAFDHLYRLPDASRQVFRALEWCEQHDTPLCLVINKESDIGRLKLRLWGDMAQIRLNQRISDAKATVTLIADGHSATIGYDELLVMIQEEQRSEEL